MGFRSLWSGYRWFIPMENNSATLALSVINAKIAQLLGVTRFNQAWGGSMAVRVDVFKRLGMDKIWQKSKDIIKHYKKCGSNWVTIVYKRGEEFIKLISECVGLRERMDVARMAFKFMKENCSIGTSISLFKWESGLTELEVEKRNKRN